jgi:hypothetical protein
MSGIT